MWANLFTSGEAAKERIAETLERTGEIVTQQASDRVKKEKEEQKAGTSETRAEKEGGDGKDATDSTENTTGTKTDASDQSKKPFFSEWRNSRMSNSNNNSPTNDQQKSQKRNQPEILSSLRQGWGNVVQATKQAVEKEQSRMGASMLFGKRGPYVRDISQPLDIEALRDAEVVYITDRLITMSHPAMQSPTDGDITPNRKLAAVSHLLQKRHSSKYMIWNLSELEYDHDSTYFDNQVMTFQFPGAPAPPLGLLLKILLSMDSWLKADERNVAVLHCLTGKGRTSTVMAAFLCWMGEAGFHDANQALEYIAECKRVENVEILTIPSQRRYVGYFSNMMDGIRPSQPPLLLKRIIMSEAPKFGKCPGSNSNDADTSDTETDMRKGQLGCAPYLQIFKAGQLVFTTAASVSFNQSKDDLPFCVPSDGSITFPAETVVQGDILVRCRHLTRKGQRVSMFRAAFHTGYVPPKVLRLGKAQLDGCCHDGRFEEDFFIDLIFEECDAAMASQHILSDDDEEDVENSTSGDGKDNDDHKVKFSMKSSDSGSTSQDTKGEVVQNEAAARRMMGTVAGSNQTASTVSASGYDSMLHRDSRFWDVIAERRDGNRKKSAAATASSTPLFYGPTIGRRREFASEVEERAKGTSEGEESTNNDSSRGSSMHSSMHTFSIGGEFDFTDNDKDEPSTQNESDSNVTEEKKVKVPKKDDLMDALMAIDDDVDDDDEEEEIEVDLPEAKEKEEAIFDTGSEEEIVFDDVNDDDDDTTSNMSNEVSDTRETKKTVESLEKDVATIESETVIEKDVIKIDGTDENSSEEDQSLVQVEREPESSENSTQEENSGAAPDDEEDNIDDYDFDGEDEDLEDLENFLMKAR